MIIRALCVMLWASSIAMGEAQELAFYWLLSLIGSWIDRKWVRAKLEGHSREASGLPG